MEGVTSSGTGARLKYGGGGFIQYDYSFGNPIAGKTGTSQNNSDGWFIGMVPNLATGVWVGNEDRAAHFRAQEEVKELQWHYLFGEFL
jgi:penicillin-binding protein 1A